MTVQRRARKAAVVVHPSPFRVLSAISILFILSIPAWVSADRPSNFRLDVLGADVIVEAEIIDVRARWEGGLIVSTISAKITAYLRGAPIAEVLEYDVLGGELDGLVQVVSGSRVPHRGQGVVLLLQESSQGLLLASPALRIHRDLDHDDRSIEWLPVIGMSLNELRRLVEAPER